MITYGKTWPPSAVQLQIHFWALKQEDEFLKSQGFCRLDIYLAIHSLLWSEDSQHRWFVLGMKSLVENQISMFLGCASSGKTYTMSAHALIDFFAFPTTSLSLVSSTEKRSLELKVWGRIKTLFNRARAKFEWLPGFVLESMMAITPDEIDDDGVMARTLDKGIICVPCVSGGRFVGMAKFQGAKAPNSPGKNDGILKHYGDEFAVMQSSILDAYVNWTVNPKFKGCGSGNPTDISDPLCTASEPIGGWDSFVDTGETQEWTSRWYGAHVVAFDGRASPNNDQPGIKYPFLVTKEWIESLKKTHGDDSWQLYQQGIGKPSRGMVSNRVITIGICEKHKAFDDVVWRGTPRVKIYAIDPAYGGGDRCVGCEMEFGLDIDGNQILLCHSPEIIPIALNSKLDSEEQIAVFVKNKSSSLAIPSENIFYDSFGRGTLGFSFAKVFGFSCPVPIDSGMRPTMRPVRHDLFVEEIEAGRKSKRLKRCDEHYSKFVTEMWFSTREAIISNQIRGLQMETAREGQMRLFKIVAGNKVEVESKDDMKERIKKSPDLYDTFAIGVEGARRLGFKIARIGGEIEIEVSKDRSWLTAAQDRARKLLKSKQLTHS